MDGLAPSPRRSDRPMVSQDAGRGSDGRRRRPGGHGLLEPADDGHLSLGRRIGVLVVLAALGGAIVLAAGGVGGNHPVAPLATATPQATPGVSASEGPLASPPTSAPAIIVPDDRLLTTSPITLRVTVPEPGTTMSGLVVRLYRNSRLLTTRKVTKVGRMRVPDVPLRRGSNKLTATIANSGGEGPRSASVTLTLDDQAPKITVKSPRTDTLIDASQITVTGRTGAGLAVTGRTSPSNKKVRAVADQNGRYTLLDMPLAQGRNLITVVSRDAAGNPGTASVVVVRGDGHLAARLKLSRDKLRIKVLPKTMDADVTVLDANGLPVDGATVEFSIVPHGQLTRTHITTTSKDGTASWSRIPLPKSGATVGQGFVTVKVTAPDGSTTSRLAHFAYK